MCVCVILYKLPSKQANLYTYVLLEQLFLGDPWRLHRAPSRGHQAVTIPELSFPSVSSGYSVGLQPPDAHMAAFGGLPLPATELGLMHLAGGCSPALLTSCAIWLNYLSVSLTHCV